jgi:hypothetical protein
MKCYTFLIFTLTILFQFSCSIQKRTFNQGYFIQLNKRYESKLQSTKIDLKDSLIKIDKNFIANNDENFIEIDYPQSDKLVKARTYLDKTNNKIQENRLFKTKNFFYNKLSKIIKVDNQTKKSKVSDSKNNIKHNGPKSDLPYILIWALALLLFGILLIFLAFSLGFIFGILLILLGGFFILFSFIFFLIYLIGLIFSKKRY